MQDLTPSLTGSIRVPELAVDATAEIVSRIPFLPAEATWVNAGRVPVIMATDRARKELKWKPQKSSRETLRETVEAHRPDDQAAAEG